MIVKTPKGFVVKSESGDKKLSKENLTKKEALKRLQQIEYFKNNPQK